MTSSLRPWYSPRLGLAVVALLVPVLAWAAPPRAKKVVPAKEPAETVEMFSAMEKGLIEVKLIAKDSTQARVLIDNKTEQPLSIKLPEAFGATPILAQAAGGAAAGGGSSNSGPQPLGGGMGGGGMMGGGGGGGGLFNVPAERVGQIKVTTVCLEHGKPDPTTANVYKVLPIEQVSSKPGVREVCQMVGSGEVPQRVAQVAAWFLANGLSWDDLMKKELRFANGSRSPYFSRQEIASAMKVVAAASKAAEQNAAKAPITSPGYSQPVQN